MKTLIFFVAMLMMASAQAGDIKITDEDGVDKYAIEGNRIYQTDPYGRKLYNKNHWVIEDGKIYEVDPYGHKVYGKKRLVISDGR